MEKNQPAFLLKISGNVTQILKNNQAVLAAEWEYPHKQTSVFVNTQGVEPGEVIKASRVIRKQFSCYGIVRSIHYCPQGVGSRLQVDLRKGKRKHPDRPKWLVCAEGTDLA